MVSETKNESQKRLVLHRQLLAWAGTVYFAWWFAVTLLLPHSFNPLLSRALVVATIFATWGATFKIKAARQHIEILFLICVCLITAHYFYLFYENQGDANWVVGSYITVIAVSLCLISARTMMSYSVFVALLSLALVYFLRPLRESVFLPGLFTILAQANIGLRSRLGLIRSLAESNDRFQLLFDQSFDGVFVHENGRIVNVNESFARLTGYSRSELLGKNILDLVERDERDSVAATFGDADVPRKEMIGVTKDGRRIELEIRAKALRDGEKFPKVATVQDISDRKKAEQERVAKLTLAENVRVRDEFISIASHEFKTPISALKLQTQIIEDDLAEGRNELATEEGLRDVLALLKRQTDRLNELVDAMLDVSKISSGRFTLDFENVDLAKIVLECTTTTRRLRPELTIDYKGPESLILEGDRRRLEQVFENLIGNAIKYGNGKPILVSIDRTEDEARLAVKDHGLGIAADAISRIFDRFERAISSRNISGLGLGLYIVRQIVEGHGGTVSVISALNAGSTFTVRLPIKA